MKKDPDLERALSRNRRWIVNNQIKHILLRTPTHTATVRSLQKRFKTLDLQGNALNWLRKYPCCFDTFTDADGEVFFRLTKRMEALVEEENEIREAEEENMSRRLAKLLMMSRHRRLNVVKLNELKRSLGFGDDYVLRFVTKYPDMFRIVNHSGRRNSMEIELCKWDDDLAVSAIEAKAADKGMAPEFHCSQSGFNAEGPPYVSPYYVNHQLDSEQKIIGTVHELLSITLWKKASILKLGHFRREFGLPEKLNLVLLKHPSIFYVSNKYKIYTVVLREDYIGSELAYKDPIVVIKEKFGELMQEGLHEYNRRRCQLNLEKKRKKLEIVVKRGKNAVDDDGEEEEEAAPEYSDDNAWKAAQERRQFYKTLFDNIFP